MDAYEYFAAYLMAPIILCIGLFGNLTALVVFFKGNLRKIGPLLIYKLMFIWDTYYINQIIPFYLAKAINLDLTTVSRTACKILVYLNYQGTAVSPFMLAYLSIERYISIRFPTRRRILIRRKNQIIYIICVFVYCSAYSVIVPFSFDLFEYNHLDLNETISSSYLACDFISYKFQLIASYLDFINRELIPCVLMVCFSYLLISAVFRSRSRMARPLNRNRNRTRHKQDNKLAVNIFFMNFTFVLLNTPASVAFFLPNVYNQNVFFLTSCIFILSYGINFYIILICNSLFRQELFKILGAKLAGQQLQVDGRTTVNIIQRHKISSNETVEKTKLLSDEKLIKFKQTN